MSKDKIPSDRWECYKKKICPDCGRSEWRGRNEKERDLYYTSHRHFGCWYDEPVDSEAFGMGLMGHSVTYDHSKFNAQELIRLVNEEKERA